MSDFKVQLARNSAPNATPEVFTVRRNWDLATFNRNAGKKLNIKVKRVFLQNGSEVTGCDEMSANELLFVSSGEDFFKHALNAPFPSFSNNSQGKADVLQQQQQGSEVLSVSVLGTGGVGKSAITLRFVRDTFFQDWDPTIEDAYKKTMDVDGQLCVLDVLDTAGQDDFHSLRPSWMINKDGYVFVFSLDQPESVGELAPFIDLHIQLNEGRRVPIVLCGNKKDLASINGGDSAALERQQRSRELAKAKAKELGAKYIETSAASGDNVNEVFEGLVKEVLLLRKRRRRGMSGDTANGNGGNGDAAAHHRSWRLKSTKSCVFM